jgi:hypothetical protein
MTDIKSLWRNQKTEDRVTLETIHQGAEQFQRRIRLSLGLEYGAIALAVAIFGFFTWVLPGSMTKAGSGLCVAAVLFIAWQLHRRMAAKRVPDLGASGLVEFQRQELVRQRDAMRSAWAWYVLPVIPGIALMILGRWYQFHVAGRTIAWDHDVIILAAIVAVLILVIIRLFQLVQIGKLQTKIDALDKLRSD